jgi:hypothetical protein
MECSIAIRCRFGRKFSSIFRVEKQVLQETNKKKGNEQDDLYFTYSLHLDYFSLRLIFYPEYSVKVFLRMVSITLRRN